MNFDHPLNFLATPRRIELLFSGRRPDVLAARRWSLFQHFSYINCFLFLATLIGFEPTISRLGGDSFIHSATGSYEMLPSGFEPKTKSLWATRSTIELWEQKINVFQHWIFQKEEMKGHRILQPLILKKRPFISFKIWTELFLVLWGSRSVMTSSSKERPWHHVGTDGKIRTSTISSKVRCATFTPRQ